MESPKLFEDLIVPVYLLGRVEGTEGMKWPRIKTDLFCNLYTRVKAQRDYDEVMAIPLADPRMNDGRREIHELNNLEEDWSVQAFLLKEKAKNLPLGKRYHARKVETFVILEGEVEALLTAYKDHIKKPLDIHPYQFWIAHSHAEVRIAHILHEPRLTDDLLFQPGFPRTQHGYGRG